jgi:hypothetical protein
MKSSHLVRLLGARGKQPLIFPPIIQDHADQKRHPCLAAMAIIQLASHPGILPHFYSLARHYDCTRDAKDAL